MASRNQSAIGPDEKLLLLALGVLVVGMIVLGLIFGVANGVASGVAGFLHSAGLPLEMARDLYKALRWGTVGLLFVAVATIASRILR